MVHTSVLIPVPVNLPHVCLVSVLLSDIVILAPCFCPSAGPSKVLFCLIVSPIGVHCSVCPLVHVMSCLVQWYPVLSSPVLSGIIAHSFACPVLIVFVSQSPWS